MAEIELTALRWRVGRKVGRTIYAQLAEFPTDADPLIGVMDSVGLAIATVRAHNSEHEREHPLRSHAVGYFEAIPPE